MLNIGPQELLLVLIIALLVVGPQRLPELSRQIGKGLREFRKVQDEVKGIARFDVDEPRTSAARGAKPTASGSAVHRTPRAVTPPTTTDEDAAQPSGPGNGTRPAAPPETGG